MSFLLDTNVVSEWVKPRPDEGLVAWLADVDEDRVFISVIVLAELRRGIERMEHGARRNRLERWLREELPARFQDRILGIDDAIADAWGSIVATRETRGTPIGAMDAFVAATAQVHELTLVTHNATDFESTVPRILDPWTRA